MDTANAPVAIEIFRAGKQTDMHGREVSISRADLAAIADAYDPAKHEAPLVIGHPQVNAPAYGWVKGLRVDGDTLLADAHQVDPAFAAIVNEGRYKKRSASFLLPTSAANPVPGTYYLNHVGWLGATAPAVKGLRDAQFAERTASPSDCVEFASDRRWGFRDVAGVFRRIRDWLIERDGAEAAEQVIPAWQIESLIEAAQPDVQLDPVSAAAFAVPLEEVTPMPDEQTADFAAREQELSQRATDLAAREQALATREHQARHADAMEFAAGLVQAGQLLPRHAPMVTELLLVLPADKPLSFAAEDGTTTEVAPAQALREFLSSLPAQVNYAEKSGADTIAAPVAFATPPGETADPTGIALHNKAMAWMQQHPGTAYLAAVKAVGG